MKIDRNIKLSDTIKPSLKGDLHCDFSTVPRQHSPSDMSKK